MKALAIAFIALAISTAASAAGDKVIVPATESKLTHLLQGCWGNWSHADFGTLGEAEEESEICFKGNGRLTFSYRYDGYDKQVKGKGKGTYQLRDNRLHLTNDNASGQWQFPGPQVDCDAVVEPRASEDSASLTISKCKTAGGKPDEGAYYFGRATR